jgi:SAM-dependent methyltransferase
VTDGASVFTDPAQAVDGAAADALAARTLQIDLDRWLAVRAEVAREAPAGAASAGESASTDARRGRAGPLEDDVLARVARVYARHSPHEAPLPGPASSDDNGLVAAGQDERSLFSLPPAGCPACGARRVRAAVARRPGPVVYGCCEACGHGVCWRGGALPGEAGARYSDPTYYEQRDARGVGYDDYGAEETYRMAKGARLVAALTGVAAAAGGRIRSLLEVGSGFGFTREAARRAGLETGGVDLNPAARAQAARRFGLTTFAGDLAAALAAAPGSGVAPGAWDAVLYQFVLEHVASVDEELRSARRALAPGGWLALLVPSMEAVERTVFGASYRSLRADHLHLFSRASLRAFLGRAGFEIVRLESGCNLHLLRSFLAASALQRLYGEGLGPDLWCVARRRAE